MRPVEFALLTHWVRLEVDSLRGEVNSLRGSGE